MRKPQALPDLRFRIGDIYALGFGVTRGSILHPQNCPQPAEKYARAPMTPENETSTWIVREVVFALAADASRPSIV